MGNEESELPPPDIVTDSEGDQLDISGMGPDPAGGDEAGPNPAGEGDG